MFDIDDFKDRVKRVNKILENGIKIEPPILTNDDILRSILSSRINNTFYNGKEVESMEHFKAKNDKQLGLCIRMLLAENFDNLYVKPILNDKHKVEFIVSINADQETIEMLQERYEILIS